jgi:hypothetical protein
MVWNKTSEETVNTIIQELHNIQKSYEDVAKTLEVSKHLVGTVARKYLPEQIRKLRYSYTCSVSKQGVKNPMFGKVGKLHHNSETEVRVSGYKTVFVPTWWSGTKVKSGRMFEHHYVWADNYKQTCLPKGCCIHHIDLNIDNNSIENLQLLTISEHMKLHGEIRKVQRLERNLVGNSVPEVQGIS